MPEAPAGLRVRDGRVAYGETLALVDADVDVAPGEVLAVLGPSGSGKSTLLRLVAGLVDPLVATIGGTVHVDGRDVTRLPPESRHTTMMFQDHALFPHRSARDNVAYAARVRGEARRPRREAADGWLVRVGLDGLGDRRPATLSGGQQQRVALARALAAAPRVLLLDEPFGQLDAPRRRDLGRLVRALAAPDGGGGPAVVMVTHDRDEAFELGDRLAVMDAGRIRQQGLPRAVHAAPVDAQVAALLGHDNLLGPGPARDAVLASCGPVAGGGDVLLVPDTALRPDERGRATGVLRARRFRGGDERWEFDVAGTVLVASVALATAAGLDLRANDTVRFDVDPADLRWLPAPTLAP